MFAYCLYSSSAANAEVTTEAPFEKETSLIHIDAINGTFTGTVTLHG